MCYRPGYHFPHIIDTNLLRTCRRIDLETRSLPAGLDEVMLWR